VAEDHGLGNGDSAIDITESTELLISAIAQHVILLNSVQCLLLSLQFDNVWVRNNFLSKFPHRIFKISREECIPAAPMLHLQYLPLNADALILMALGCYHHICLIQDEHFDFLGIDELQFGAPVQHSARCANDNLLLTFIASDSICKLQLWVKLPHLFDHLSCLKCQLVCWGKAQALRGQRNNERDITNTNRRYLRKEFRPQ
uniref:Uncharacterized protein n=1 Tax=Coturnix japonica TaxID=93934 RepID=A0A8C2U8U2_COTJA